MSEFIPLSIPNIKGNAEKYVVETIRTGWISSVGSFVDRFEKEFAEYVGAPYAVAVVNGTAALHISLIVAGVEAGDEVLVPSLTFVAPVNAVKYCGANPVFLGASSQDMGIDVNVLEDFLKTQTTSKDGKLYNKVSGARIAAIIPVHAMGHPVALDEMCALCEEYGIPVIEDSTESLGSEYKGVKTGNFGLLGTFSFNGNKIISCGGGGMIVTHDEKLAKRAKHISSTAKTDPVHYDHDEVGYNYRMVNVLAALGVSQLELIDEFVEIKRTNFDTYQRLLAEAGVEHFSLLKELEGVKSNYWFYSLVKSDEISISIREMVDLFAQEKIQVRPIWKLIDTLPMYKDYQSFGADSSQRLFETVLSIPCSTSLTTPQIERVVSVIRQIENTCKESSVAYGKG